MQRSDVQIGLLIVAALVIGFLLALLLFGGDDGNNAITAATTGTTGTTTSTTGTGGTTTTQPTSTAPTPQSPGATVPGCIALWNQPGNRGAQIVLVNISSQQPVRVHVGQTSDVPPQCLVTVVANNGDAYVFPEGGGTTFPYAPAASKQSSSSLSDEQKKANALEQRDGTLAEH